MTKINKPSNHLEKDDSQAGWVKIKITLALTLVLVAALLLRDNNNVNKKPLQGPKREENIWPSIYNDFEEIIVSSQSWETQTWEQFKKLLNEFVKYAKKRFEDCCAERINLPAKGWNQLWVTKDWIKEIYEDISALQLKLTENNQNPTVANYNLLVLEEELVKLFEKYPELLWNIKNNEVIFSIYAKYKLWITWMWSYVESNAWFQQQLKDEMEKQIWILYWMNKLWITEMKTRRWDNWILEWWRELSVLGRICEYMRILPRDEEFWRDQIQKLRLYIKTNYTEEQADIMLENLERMLFQFAEDNPWALLGNKSFLSLFEDYEKWDDFQTLAKKREKKAFIKTIEDSFKEYIWTDQRYSGFKLRYHWDKEEIDRSVLILSLEYIGFYPNESLWYDYINRIYERLSSWKNKHLAVYLQDAIVVFILEHPDYKIDSNRLPISKLWALTLAWKTDDINNNSNLRKDIKAELESQIATLMKGKFWTETDNDYAYQPTVVAKTTVLSKALEYIVLFPQDNFWYDVLRQLKQKLLDNVKKYQSNLSRIRDIEQAILGLIQEYPELFFNETRLLSLLPEYIPWNNAQNIFDKINKKKISEILEICFDRDIWTETLWIYTFSDVYRAYELYREISWKDKEPTVLDVALETIQDYPDFDKPYIYIEKIIRWLKKNRWAYSRNAIRLENLKARLSMFLKDFPNTKLQAIFNKYFLPQKS